MSHCSPQTLIRIFLYCRVNLNFEFKLHLNVKQNHVTMDKLIVMATVAMASLNSCRLRMYSVAMETSRGLSNKHRRSEKYLSDSCVFIYKLSQCESICVNVTCVREQYESVHTCEWRQLRINYDDELVCTDTKRGREREREKVGPRLLDCLAGLYY